MILTTRLLERLRERLIAEAPLCSVIFNQIAPCLLSAGSRVNASKDLNDPIWKIIEASALEIAVLDAPLLQRLRSVRQLGLAHLVFPGAHHTRLEHSLGVLNVAKEMLSRMLTELRLAPSDASEVEKIVGLAALLHDSGHFIFSHVGERVVGDLFSRQFQAVEKVLNEELSDPITYKSGVHRGTYQKPPRAAELMSALFVLSPAMQDLLEAQGGIQTSVRELLPTVASLIIGRAYSLCYDGKYMHFIKSIVSGDLDADKIDYLARDGYFAGVPLAVDVDRLLSQLRPITFDAQTHIDGLNIDFATGGVDKYLVLGLKPTGASAMEMLVLTRAYLFDRIYLHHKVRAAERLAERILRQYLVWLASVTAKCPEVSPQVFERAEVQCEILRFMLGEGGDDAALAGIAAGRPTGDAAKELRDLALGLLRRRLPVRSLPIARRTLAGAASSDQSVPTMLRTRWPEVHRWLRSPAGQRHLEQRICDLTGLKLGADVIVDFAQRDPINEDPDIWVQTSPSAQPERLNRHFSVEQLSNAYQELKETGWIFSWAADRALVAAAAAIALNERFGVIPTEHALNLSKITPVQYDSALGNIERQHDIHPEVGARLRDKAEAPFLYIHKGDVFEFIPLSWDLADRDMFSERLARGINYCKLPTQSAGEFQALLPILRLLLKHTYCSHNKPKWRQSECAKEHFFADDLILFLKHEDAAGEFIQYEELTRDHGRIDLAFQSKYSAENRYVIELKKVKINPSLRKRAKSRASFRICRAGMVSYLYYVLAIRWSEYSVERCA